MTTPFDVAEQELGDLAPARKCLERNGWKVKREQQETREDYPAHITRPYNPVI